MKRYGLYVLTTAVLLCLISGLVFAQDATPEATGEALAPCTALHPCATSPSTDEAIMPQATVYGEVGGVQLTLDVYEPPPSDSPRAAVILIHGGAGSFGDRGAESDRAEGLAVNGYVAFNFGEGDDGTAKPPGQVFPCQVEDFAALFEPLTE